MYLIMDLVVNHCSDQHEWFQKALKDPEGEYGQYFYLRKEKKDILLPVITVPILEEVYGNR